MEGRGSRRVKREGFLGVNQTGQTPRGINGQKGPGGTMKLVPEKRKDQSWPRNW